MTIKTAEQIATEIMGDANDDGYESVLSAWDLKQVLIAAIEADRSQRADALDALHAWASTVSQFMAEDKSNDWSEEIGALAEIEQMYELVNKAGEGN